VAIQCAQRQRRARRAALGRALTTYELLYDPGVGREYYYNRNTDDSSWAKPAALGNHRLQLDQAAS
jgi:hypothetical protein